MKKYNDIIEVLNGLPVATKRGEAVRDYAVLLCEQAQEQGEEVAPQDPQELRRILLNGAKDWAQFSRGGCALVYNGDIAAALYEGDQLARVMKYGGDGEQLLAEQAQVLAQAADLIEKLNR